MLQPSRAYVGHASHVLGIRFSPDNKYVMSVGGYDRSAMQWRVLPTAHDDIVVDKPDFGDFTVYQAPKKQALVLDPLVPAQEVVSQGTNNISFSSNSRYLFCCTNELLG
jgi:hypothetical protein